MIRVSKQLSDDLPRELGNLEAVSYEEITPSLKVYFQLFPVYLSQLNPSTGLAGSPPPQEVAIEFYYIGAFIKRLG